MIKYRSFIYYKRQGATLTALIPYTNYSIKVAAVSTARYIGPYSPPMTVQTAEDSMSLEV